MKLTAKTLCIFLKKNTHHIDMLTMTVWVLIYICTGSFPSSAFQASWLYTSRADCKSQGCGCKTHIDGCSAEWHLCLTASVLPLIMAKMIHFSSGNKRRAFKNKSLSCPRSLPQTAHFMINTWKNNSPLLNPPSNTTTDTDDNSHYVSCCIDTMSRCMCVHWHLHRVITASRS